MELSRTLIESANETLARQAEAGDKLISVEGTPFFLSQDGEGIIPHGKILYEGVEYYIGTIDPEA